MRISGEKAGQAWAFAINGRLDAQSASEAETIIKKWLAAGETRLVGDLSGLDYISSAGLRVMLVAAKAVKAQGGGVWVHGLKDTVRSVFEISGFSAIIPIAADQAQAMSWAGGQG